MSKIAFQKYDITSTCFLGIAQSKIKILLRNFVCVFFVSIFITYIPLPITSKLWILHAINFEKSKFRILEVNIEKNQKNLRQPFCRAVNFTSMSMSMPNADNEAQWKGALCA